jgi:multicomponent Na+:H+ antiporter subunit D
MIEALSYHPAIWLILSALLMLASIFRYQPIFNISSVFFPLVAMFMIGSIENSGEMDIFGFKLIILHNHLYSKFFAYAFLVSLIIGVFSALSSKHYTEIILAHLACASALIAVFAGDLIILFFATEALMIFSFIMVFIGNTTHSKSAAIRYFMMHFISGVLMLAGVILITTLSESREIVNLSSNLINHDPYFLASSLILLALLINGAIPPFSSWMIDAYPETKASGTLFLISYTSKVALFCIMMLFQGAPILYYFGVVTLLYGAIYSVIETNLRRIACFSSISHTGFALICISYGIDDLMVALAALMFFKIAAKALILSCTGRMAELLGITHVGHLSKLPSSFKVTIFGFFFGLCFILAFPFTGTFVVKQVIIEYVGEDPAYMLYLVCTTLCFLSFPILELFISKNKLESKRIPHPFSKIAIFVGIIALTIASISISNTLEKDYNIISYISLSEIANQSLLFVSALTIALVAGEFRRKDSNILLNFDFFYRKLIFYCNFDMSEYANYLRSDKELDTTRISQAIFRPISLAGSIFILFLVTIIILIKNLIIF